MTGPVRVWQGNPIPPSGSVVTRLIVGEKGTHKVEKRETDALGADCWRECQGLFDATVEAALLDLRARVLAERVK